MPYILLKQSSLAPGLLQTLDLKPNTSIREDAYQPVGQTGYRRLVPNDASTLTAGVADQTARGLTAWFLSEVNDGTGAAASGTATVAAVTGAIAATGLITTDLQANFSDGEIVTISDGTLSVTFEFDVSGTNVPAPGNVEVDISGDTTAADVSATLEGVIAGSGLDIATLDNGGSVSLTNNTEGTVGNVAITDTVGAAGWAVAGMSGGVDADTFTITTAPAFLITAVNAPRTPGASDCEDSASAGSDIAAATSLAAAINDDANWAATGITRPVSADNVGGTSAVVTITALDDGTVGNYVLASSTGVRLAVVGMAGGVDADALTNANAADNAVDVLDRLNYDDVDPALALTLAAINGALTDGAITAAQVSEILDILAGRNFVLESGASVAPGGVWASGSGAFDDDEIGFRRLYDTVNFRISFAEGRLSLLAADDFNDEGAAVAVYNNDGTLYTG